VLSAHRVVVLRPTRYKTDHFGDVSPKTKPNTTKHAMKRTTQNKDRKKQKPGLVAFYNIRPGNGAGLLSNEKTSKGGDK